MRKTIEFGLTIKAKAIIFVSALILIINIFQPWSIAGIDTASISFILLAILISSWIISRGKIFVAEKLDIKRIIPKYVYELDEVPVKLYITNKTPLGIYNVVIEDIYPETMKRKTGHNLGVVQIYPKSEIEIKYTLQARGIGEHVFKGVIIKVWDPLGLFHTSIHYTEINTDRIRVMPTIPHIDITEILAKGFKLELGAKKTPHSGLSTEFRDIREYVPGDETRRIDWKATAKLNKLMIREYELERKSNIVIILELSRNMFLGELGTRKIDYAARTITFIFNYAYSKKDNVGLIVLTPRHADVIPITTASETLIKSVLLKLSSIPVYPFEESIEWNDTYISKALEKLGLRDKTLFIIISDLESEYVTSNVRNIARILRSLRHEVIIISPLTTLFETKLLRGIDAAIYKVIGYISIQERKKYIDELIKLGVPVIDVGPNDLIPYTLVKIEQYRRMIVI